MIGKRIREYRKRKGIKTKAFSKLIGISQGSLSGIENEKFNPSTETIINIIRNTDINANWLLTGESEPRGAGKGIQKGDEMFQLPIFDVQASAGDGREIIEERVTDHFPVKLTWIKQDLRLNPANLVVISARGDSMEPTLRNEDLIIIDKSQFEVLDDAIYIVNMEGLLMVKRLQRLLGGRLCIKSDNPAYQDQLVEKDQLGQVHVIGRVVWVGRRM